LEEVSAIPYPKDLPQGGYTRLHETPKRDRKQITPDESKPAELRAEDSSGGYSQEE
jgi:hypothetical protein